VKKKLEEKEKEDAKKKDKDGQKDGVVNGQKTSDGPVDTAEEGASKDKDTETPTNGDATISPTPAKPDETPDAMEVDQEVERVEDSEPEEDAAAMQIEMEMRGPPRQPTASASKSPEARRSTGGFTAINGQK
jgi:DNA polymerase epsilon subunit 4